MRHLTRIAGILLLLGAGTSHVCAQGNLPTQSGNVMLSNVLATVQRHASISAKIRHHSRINEQTLMGSGKYLQQATENRPLICWEMNTQIAGETASYLQVFNGEYLYTDRRLPSGREVTRLDVSRYQTALQNRPVSTLSIFQKSQGQGGLSQLLAQVIQDFDFAPPRPTQLEGMPVFALLGHWRVEELKKIWPEATENSANWPAHIPHHVLVLVGHNMFPYVFEHRRFEDAGLASNIAGLRPAADPLLRYEIYEVSFAKAIDPENFKYHFDGESRDIWKDETSLMIEKIAKNEPVVQR